MVRVDARSPDHRLLGVMGALLATGCVLESNPSFIEGDASTSSGPLVPSVTTSGTSTDIGDTGSAGGEAATTTGDSTSGPTASGTEATTAGVNTEGGGPTTDAETTLGTESGGSSTGAVDPCEDGILNGDETDVDCGGVCGGCERCAQCAVNDDCVDSCLDGQCVEELEIIVDYEVNCGDGPATTFDLEPGWHFARVTGGAGSIWGADNFNEGLTWEWRTSCDLSEISGMSSDPLRHATPELAVEAIEANEVDFYSPGETVTCSVVDNACANNRGAVMFSIFARCDA